LGIVKALGTFLIPPLKRARGMFSFFSSLEGGQGDVLVLSPL
jgi:hypothetical protein